MTKLIFGCGYLGERVARRWRNAGMRVVIVTRSGARADEFKRQGNEAIVADVTKPQTLEKLPPAETVFYAIGYDRSSEQSIQDVYEGGMRNVLAALPSDVGRFIYVSTTGVYGDAAGDWVDEQTPPDPQRDGGRASLAAEQALAESPFSSRSIILRLAGIYGPGRIPFLDALRAGQPIPAPSEGHLNLIHVDDAAAVVVAASEQEFNWGDAPATPRIYCVSDGHPVRRGDYYREVARLIGAVEAEFAAPDPESPRAARAASDRRVSNQRMVAELRVKLAYPDYRAGLKAILNS